MIFLVFLVSVYVVADNGDRLGEIDLYGKGFVSKKSVFFRLKKPVDRIRWKMYMANLGNILIFKDLRRRGPQRKSLARNNLRKVKQKNRRGKVKQKVEGVCPQNN
jgi:hypothetical protein